MMELEMNRSLQQAKVQRREKCLEVLSQSHSWFNRLMEISSCETFRLGWEQALKDPSARIISSPEEYDDLNKIERKNYDLEYYVSKENLIVPSPRSSTMRLKTGEVSLTFQSLSIRKSKRWIKLTQN